MRGALPLLVAVALTFSATLDIAAQDTVTVGVRQPLAQGAELPRRVADQLVEFYNRPTTLRFSGRTRIPEGRTVEGDVAILGGPVELAGVIAGDLVVLNGDITLREGAHVQGDLTVVGGITIGAEDGRVDGFMTTYPAVFRYRRTEEGIAYAGSQRPEPIRPRRRRLDLPRWTLGESEIYVSARPYNRVEALPIAIGPRITTGGRNPLRIDALLIYRTEAGFDPDENDAGYQVRLRQWLGGRRAIWIEGGVHSIIDPVEDWKLTNLENSLALLLFRRDYRDYYERQGFFGGVGWRATPSLTGSLEFRIEDHNAVSARSPWTIFFNTDDRFRANAAADGGDLESLVLTLGLDTRNDRDEPWSGWFGKLRLEQAVGGRLSERDPDFTHFFLDLRRYNRVSRTSVLALRAVTGGRAGGGFLPSQRQHVLGGAGSLPGYNQLQFDCGARARTSFGTVPDYGCERFALFQAEYRSGLDFHFHWDYDQGPEDFYGDVFSADFDPTIVLFYNAGAAWDTRDGFLDHLTDSDNWLADIGGGIELGGLGFYTAYPLTGSGGFNFIVRLSARF